MYKDLANILKEYWKHYGGLSAFVKSPYLHISFIVTAIVVSCGKIEKSHEIAMQLIPNILGFSIGSFAIIFSSMEKIKETFISKMPEFDYKKSLNIVITTFLHFIFVQNAVLMLALIKNFSIVDRFIYINTLFLLILIYAMSLVFSTAISLYRFMRMLLELY